MWTSCWRSVLPLALLALRLTVGSSASQVGRQPSLESLLEPLVERVVERVVERALERVVERAVERALERAVDRVVERAVERAVERVSEHYLDRALKTASLELACKRKDGANSTRSVSPESETELECDERPSPLPPCWTSGQRPAVLACARSCLQLLRRGRRRNFFPVDGVYWFTGMPVPVLCDFSHDGGGWTLLLSARSASGWNLRTVTSRAENAPSMKDDYSILRLANTIRDLGEDEWLWYRIEAGAEGGRRRSGGVWLAPSTYSFCHNTSSQTEVVLVTPFGNWEYKAHGIKRRMPWLPTPIPGEPLRVLLTTSGFSAQEGGWGSLLMDEGFTAYTLSSWINPEMVHSGAILYWMRE